MSRRNRGNPQFLADRKIIPQAAPEKKPNRKKDKENRRKKTAKRRGNPVLFHLKRGVLFIADRPDQVAWATDRQLQRLGAVAGPGSTPLQASTKPSTRRTRKPKSTPEKVPNGGR